MSYGQLYVNLDGVFVGVPSYRYGVLGHGFGGKQERYLLLGEVTVTIEPETHNVSDGIYAIVAVRLVTLMQHVSGCYLSPCCHDLAATSVIVPSGCWIRRAMPCDPAPA